MAASNLRTADESSNEYYNSMISMKELILATYVEINVEVEKDLRHGITSLTLTPTCRLFS